MGRPRFGKLSICGAVFEPGDPPPQLTFGCVCPSALVTLYLENCRLSGSHEPSLESSKPFSVLGLIHPHQASVGRNKEVLSLSGVFLGRTPCPVPFFSLAPTMTLLSPPISRSGSQPGVAQRTDGKAEAQRG